jgi:hypothetical protein
MPGSGTSPEAVSAAVTGLTPNTTYDFRVVATNAGGTGEGANETFKTQAEEAKEVVSAKEAIEKLLQEVSTAQIPLGIRAELSHLLRVALRDVERQGGAGSQASADAQRVAQAALRTGGESWDGRHHEQPGERACAALNDFVFAILRDQTRPMPRLPPELAAAWIEAAGNIFALLPCSTDHESERGAADHQWDPGDHEWGRADREWGRSERR